MLVSHMLSSLIRMKNCIIGRSRDATIRMFMLKLHLTFSRWLNVLSMGRRSSVFWPGYVKLALPPPVLDNLRVSASARSFLDLNLGGVSSRWCAVCCKTSFARTKNKMYWYMVFRRLAGQSTSCQPASQAASQAASQPNRLLPESPKTKKTIP